MSRDSASEPIRAWNTVLGAAVFFVLGAAMIAGPWISGRDSTPSNRGGLEILEWPPELPEAEIDSSAPVIEVEVFDGSD